MNLSVTLTTKDSVSLAGNYIPGSLPFGVVLLHMMPATKESYDSLAQEISHLGLHTLAIDLRGHGESGGGDYQTFTDEQHQASHLDIDAAVEYLRKQNPDIMIGLVGASIGANLSIQHAVRNKTAFAILLSAGLNYKGVDAQSLVKRLPTDLPVYFVAAKDDERSGGNNAQMNQTLLENCSSQNKKLQIFETGGHGTLILTAHPELQQTLLAWIKENINVE